MKLILSFLMICLIFVLPNCRIEDGWKGISVLHTTRDEVEKILGKPLDDSNVSYRTDDALINITYSNLPCSNTKSYQGNYKVAQNTVLQYQVVLKKDIKLSELEWQSDLYKRYEDKHSLNRVYYSNMKNGILIKTLQENGVEFVRGIDFEPTVEQNAENRCENE